MREGDIDREREIEGVEMEKNRERWTRTGL